MEPNVALFRDRPDTGEVIDNAQIGRAGGCNDCKDTMGGIGCVIGIDCSCQVCTLQGAIRIGFDKERQYIHDMCGRFNR